MKSAPFKIYSASAGSGKTFSLVKEYLKVCLQTKSPKKFTSILAITFTNKAAAEMKERIIKTLKAFSDPEKATQTEQNMVALLAAETGLDLKELAVRARLVFEAMLHNYSQLSVGTIDKFTHRVIRTFAQDLDLSANFEVEIEHQSLLKQAVDSLISKAGKNEKLTKLFIRFIQDKTSDDKSWLIENDIFVAAEELLKESGQVHCESLKKVSLGEFFVFHNNILKYINKVDERLSVIGSDFFNFCRDKNVNPDWFAGGARSGLAKYFSYLKDGNWKKYQPSHSNLNRINSNVWHASKAPRDEWSKIDEVRASFLPFMKIALKIIDDYPKYILFRLVSRNFYSVAVLNEVSKEIQQIKELNNIVPIGEFNKKIADVLQNEEGDFIYERLGERYSNYFIDEFQDTSELQWKNLFPLIENAVADGLKPGSAMLVGDAKQAIYRWRGGVVDLFIGLQQLAEETPSRSAYKMELVSLKKNFRSAAEIVNFNNRLFSSIADKIDDKKYQNIYKSLNTEETKGSGGYVSLRYLENGSEHDNLQKKACLDTIRDLKKGGFSYADICILTRTKAKGAIIVKALSDEGVPVISSESLLLEHSVEVLFLLNFLRFLNEPNHPRHRFKLIEFLSGRKLWPWASENTHIKLNTLCLGSDELFFSFLKDLVGDQDLLGWRSLSLMELCHKIIKSFELNETARIYMQFFLDEVLVYSNKSSQNLFGFLSYWEEHAHKFSIAIPDGINAVQVMTIHKSKGLEFPVVLLPFANWNATTERGAKAWVSIREPEFAGLPTSLLPLSPLLEESTGYLKALYKNHQSRVLLDNINMLYVALTRAEKQLYIFTSKSERGKNLSGFFDSFLDSIGELNNNKTHYVFGKKRTSSVSVSTKNMTIPTPLPIKDVYKIIRINRMAPKIWAADSPEKQTDRGRKIHEILSYIKTIADTDKAITKALREGLITTRDVGDVKGLLLSLLKNPKVEPYFLPGLKIKNEAEILLQNGRVIRPDRLVFYEDKISIIDFKTGAPNKDHKAQILEYKSHIENLGYLVKELILIYINKESVKLITL